MQKSISIQISFFSIAVLFSLASCKHNPIVADDALAGNTSVICDTGTIYFQNQVLPLLVSNCAKTGCHDVETAEKDQIFTNYNDIITTGKIEPFNINAGKIYERISETDITKRMPPDPDSALTQQQINLITTWINQGALNNSCLGPATCDTANVKYSLDIKPLIENKCLGCHNFNYYPNSGNIEMSDFAQIQDLALNGKLYGAVSHSDGYKPMPRYISKITDCEINLIKAWANHGAPNN